MNFKITTLVENTVSIGGSRKLIGEHGLAFLIETQDRNILFDTGQYLALENNARVLGTPVSKNDLAKATGEKLETIIRYLQRFNLEKIVGGHCTGNHAIQALYTRFKDKVILNTVGNVITF